MQTNRENPKQSSNIGSALPEDDEMLHAQNMDLEEEDDDENDEVETALMAAVESGDLGRVRSLIDSGASPNLRGSDRDTPLHAAVQIKDPTVARDITQVLIERKARVYIYDELGDTPLHKAAQSGSLAVIQYLASIPNINLNLRETYFGQYPVHYAVSRKDDDALPILKCMVEAKADIRARDGDGETALHGAYKARTDVQEYLISTLNMNVRVQNTMGVTPLHVAVSAGELNYAKRLAKADAKLPPGYIRLVDMKEDQGYSPLLFAAVRGDLAMVKWLVTECRVNVTHTNHKQKNALRLASETNRKDVMRFLLEQEALRKNIHAKTERGLTPRQRAIVRGHAEIAQILQACESGRDNPIREHKNEAEMDTLTKDISRTPLTPLPPPIEYPRSSSSTSSMPLPKPQTDLSPEHRSAATQESLVSSGNESKEGKHAATVKPILLAAHARFIPQVAQESQKNKPENTATKKEHEPGNSLRRRKPGKTLGSSLES